MSEDRIQFMPEVVFMRGYEWNIPRHKLRELLANYRDKLYQGEWVFIVDDSSDKKLNRHQCNDLIYKDYTSNGVTVAINIFEASITTNINQGTIGLRIRNNDKRLLSKYVFQSVKSDINWPVYSKEEAIESEKRYIANTVKRNNKAFI